MYYYHFDGLGSVVALSDVNSVLVERYTYDVFGRPTIRDANGTEVEVSAFGNPYLFTGRAWDAETALYYYRARYYDYATARFLQPDPMGYGDGINRYLYCGNNPIMLVDPLGLCKGGFLQGAAQAAYAWAAGVNLGTRVLGGLRAVTGIGEVAIGYAFGTATCPTVAGALAGAALGTHGIDDVQAGIRTAWRGENVDSLSSQAAQGFGVSRETANFAEAAATIVAAGAMGYANAAASATAGASVKTFEEVTVRSTLGADGGTSMIIKTVNAETGETVKIVHRVVDATGKVIHEDVKFVKP